MTEPVTATFEIAGLADTLKKAFACTPKKGAAWDKSAGIVFEFNPTDRESMIIRATNLDVYYMEWVDALKVSGPDSFVRWRFPSALITGVVGSLPIGSGKTVTFEDKTGECKQLQMTSGRTKSRFNLIDTSMYPTWPAFDPTDLSSVGEFGTKMEQVEWACDKSHEILRGIRFDGENLYATNRYRLAVVPFKTGMTEAFTLPAGILSSILKKTGDGVKIGADEHQFYLMPDEHTQVRTVLLAGPYPNVSRIMEQEKPDTIQFNKNQLNEMIVRSLNFSGSDRIPTMRIFIGQEEVRVMMSNEELGMIGDVLELPGQCDHDFLEIKLTPQNLQDALAQSPNDLVKLHYDRTKSTGILLIDGGGGYRAWVMPRTGDATTP